MNIYSKGELMLNRPDELSLFWAYDNQCSTDSDLVLLDNVQFIYELSLAELELADMEKSYSEMYRVLKPDKYAVVIIGNAVYQGKEIKTVEFTIDFMTKLGFRLERNILKLIFGLYNVMKKENILIFKKVK